MLVARCSDQSISTRNTVWSLPNFKRPQGSGKSSAIRILSNGWFAELEGFTGKESAEVLAGGSNWSNYRNWMEWRRVMLSLWRDSLQHWQTDIDRQTADTLSVFPEVLYLLDQRMRHHICMTVLEIEGSGPSVCRHLSGAKEVLSRILESTIFKALHLNLLAGVSSTSHFNVWFCIKHSHELSYEPLCRQHCELNGWGDGERVKYL